MVFNKCSNYEYLFIIKELMKEFLGQFGCLGENTKKYITFLVPIIKGNENYKTVTHKKN